MYLRITIILLCLCLFGCGSGSKSSNSITPSPTPDKAGPPVTKEQNLISASKDGNIDKVRDSLENGVDIDYVDDDGRTALMYASQNGHIDIVRILIEQNADVNYQDDDGNTPTSLASENGHSEVIDVLIESGATPAPSPTPAPSLTPAPSPAPTPDPTPTPTPVLRPSPVPTPTPSPQPSPVPSPTPQNVEVNVTGLVNTTKALRNKEWRWGCEEYNKIDKKRKSIDCTYRHVINKKNSHQFASSVKYDNTKKATQKGASGDDGTKYYIHVQAKSKSNNIASKVKSVYALLDTTPPTAPQSSNVKAPTGRSTGNTFRVTVNNLKKGDTVTIYVEGGSSSSNFLGLRFLASFFDRRNTEGGNCRDGNEVGKATVSSGTSVAVTVTAGEGTNSYYAQVIDEAGNRSGCGEVFTYPENVLPLLPIVTGLESDTTPRRVKSWQWGCTTESTHPCEYRYVVNQKATHTFDSSMAYTITDRANTSGKADGRWYLHVQAKNIAGPSEVKSVSVRIDKTKPETPNTHSVKVTLLNRQTHSLRVTFRDLIQGERVFLYNVSNCQSSSLGTATVGDNNEAVITLTATSNRQNYYARVIDEAGNRSGCGQVFTYPENVLPLLPIVTGLESDTTPRSVKSWQWGCTTESTHPCEYRYVVNQKATHTFDSTVTYSANNRTNTSGKADGRWYLHVQAKNIAGPSEVKSVSARIKTTPHSPSPTPGRTPASSIRIPDMVGRIINNCWTNPNYNACIYSASRSPNYAVNITDNVGSYLENNHYKIRPDYIFSDKTTLERATLINGKWRSSSRIAYQPMAYYWFMYQREWMKLNAGGWYADHKEIDVVTPCNNPKTCSPIVNGGWGGYWSSYSNKIVMMPTTSVHLIMHEAGHANITYANKRRTGWYRGRRCDSIFNGTWCCNTFLGCYSAINEGQADFHSFLITSSIRTRQCSKKTAQAQFQCSSGQIHNMGFIYNSIWYDIYTHPQTNKPKIAQLFHNHLSHLSYSDDFADAGVKILNLARQGGYSNQVYQIIGEAFVKRGLMSKSGNQYIKVATQ